jgi:CHAT domain-containing protein
LITLALPEANAARAGIRRGDVILAYAGQDIGPELPLPAAIAGVNEKVEKRERPVDEPVAVRYWRNGEVSEAQVSPGKLGVQVFPGEPSVGLEQIARAERGYESLKAEVSQTDQVRLYGGRLVPLPGTAREAYSIARALERAGGAADLLLGEEASVGRLAAVVAGKRYVHLATHGLMGSRERPYDASLALARPKEVSPQDIGFLRLEDLLREWRGRLEGCRLVVLSACESQRGVRTGGGRMALPWGFFYAGAQSVVASLWKVDDRATALLMGRFYEDLLGAHGDARTVDGRTYRAGTPLGLEAALREAKAWLRGLSWEDADRELARLEREAQRRGKERVAKESSPRDGSDSAETRGPEKPKRGDEQAPPGSRAGPYEHPFYWAAFVLAGSPE